MNTDKKRMNTSGCLRQREAFIKIHIRNIILILIIKILQGCGTLGGFQTIHFHCSKAQLSSAIDSLYRDYPTYRIPEKWKTFDDWKGRGYSFLDSRIFYFKNPPEEMYYITFLGDSLTQSRSDEIDIAIRAINNGNPKWILNKDLNENDIKRVEDRFETEILSKIEYHYYKSD